MKAKNVIPLKQSVKPTAKIIQFPKKNKQFPSMGCMKTALLDWDFSDWRI